MNLETKRMNVITSHHLYANVFWTIIHRFNEVREEKYFLELDFGKTRECAKFLLLNRLFLKTWIEIDTKFRANLKQR